MELPERFVGTARLPGSSGDLRRGVLATNSFYLRRMTITYAPIPAALQCPDLILTVDIVSCQFAS